MRQYVHASVGRWRLSSFGPAFHKVAFATWAVFTTVFWRHEAGHLVAMLSAHRDAVERAASVVLEKEEIGLEEAERLVRPSVRSAA